MNFFGVGGAELVAILVIMLVFAGPKRMIHWSYVLGVYLAKFRRMWSQTVDLVQKEFDEAGVDITLPKEPPTRHSLNRAIADAVKPMTNPVQQSIDEVKKDLDAFQELSDTLLDKKPAPAAVKPPAPKQSPDAEKRKTPEPAAKATAPGMPDWGSWGAANTSANGNAADFGTWSETAPDN